MKKDFHLFKKIDPGSYPCRNKSFADLPGEHWKDIPDFEGMYMISDLGRVKSLARTIYCINGSYIHTKEKIMAPVLQKGPNYYMRDFTSHLIIGLSKERKRHMFSIRRLVYNCFVNPIDLSGHDFYILCKDGNGLNMDYRNLEKATFSEKQSRIFERERAISYWEICPEAVELGRLKRQRQITQYDLQGKKIKVYPNIKAAAVANGIETSNISVVLSGSHLSAGKYIWRYGDGPEEINLTGYWVQGKLKGAAKRWKKVTQYDLKGERIAIYSSIKEASEATGINDTLISGCIGGKLNGTKGFVWKAGEGRKKIGKAKLVNNGKFYGMNKKKVAQYTMDGKLVAVYDSITLAARAAGVDQTAINRAVKGIGRQSVGYRWKYATGKQESSQNDLSPLPANSFIKPGTKKTPVQGPPLFPYQNKSLSDLEEERWKEIPGLDGQYLISNLGRIKALSRYIIKVNAIKGYWTKERIMAQAADVKEPNPNTNESVTHLAITIRYENRCYSIIPSRMVYHLFVKEIDMDSTDILIKYKDGNGLNCCSSNLAAVTRSEHNKICFEKGQMIPSYHIDPSRFKNFRFKGNPNGKRVCQYNHKGELLNTFESQKEASEKTGIRDSDISRAINRKIETAAGYIWRYEGQRFATEKQKRQLAMYHGTRKIVTQYDMKGHKIGIYYSLKDASLATGADTTQILRSTQFEHLSAKGFLWRAGEGEATINVSSYWDRIAKNQQSRSCPVDQYDAKGKLMNTYTSIKQAMKETGINDTAISRAIKSKRITKNGSTWKYHFTVKQ